MNTQQQHLDWLIIANGPLMPVELIKKLQAGKKTIAADGAIISCLARNIIPEFVAGDLDSIDRTIIKDCEKNHKIKFLYLPDQNATDLEKSINFITQFQPNSITICQAIGARLDHSLYNLRLLKRVYSVIKKIMIVTETEKIYYIKDKTVVVQADKIEPLALISFPKAVISSNGLKYDMNKLTLEFAKQESTSNHLIKPIAHINIQGEVLLIISHATELVFTVPTTE